MFNLKWIVLAVAVIMYLLVIIFQDKKIWFTTGSAILLLILGMCFPGQIFRLESGAVSAVSDSSRWFPLVHTLGNLINWNVLMIYVGAMTIAALFLYSKVPALIADVIVGKCRSTGVAVVMILALTGFISIFVENVATVLVMAPIALSISKKLKINPVPFMIGLAVMSNLEGTATLVGDPPSMIFASYSGYTFNDFFVHAGKISIFFFIQAGLLVGCLFFYCFFAKYKEKSDVEKEPVISWVPFVLLLSMIFGLAVISFFSDGLSYASGGFVLALGIAGILWYIFNQKKTSAEVKELVFGLDWETIFFLMGIFVVVGAISEVGLLQDLALFLARLTNGSELAGFVLILLVSVLISGFVDNVPYIIVMLPVAGNLAAQMNIDPALFMFALLIGSCLGGNLTPYGASANVVALGILKDEGHPVNFGGFLKIAAPFTILTTAAAAVTLWAVWH